MKQKILVETIHRIWTEAEVDLPAEAFKDLNDWIAKNPEVVKEATLKLSNPLATSLVGFYYTKEDVAAINYLDNHRIMEDADEMVSESLHDIAAEFIDKNQLSTEDDEVRSLVVQKIFNAFYFHMAAEKLPTQYKDGGESSL